MAMFSLAALFTPGTSPSAARAADMQSPQPSPDPPPTYADESYGPHERNVLDFWLAEGSGPRPLLIYIHGGGWTGGDKAESENPQRRWLTKGVSYAAINYRFSTDAPLPAPVHDAARAVQFLRTKRVAWNIDTTRICLTGVSAGACTAMWLLCHDDLANPKAADPVLRESTRIAGAAVFRGQTSIDPRQIERWLGPNVLQHRMIPLAVGERTIEDALKNYAKHRELYSDFSPYSHVSGDDPPLFMTCDADLSVPARHASHGIHHPMFGVKLKEKADAVGMECHLLVGKGAKFKSKKYPSAVEFLEAMLRVR